MTDAALQMKMCKMMDGYLVGADQVNHDHHVGQADKPVWVEEAESSQQVTGG